MSKMKFVIGSTASLIDAEVNDYLAQGYEFLESKFSSSEHYSYVLVILHKD